MMSSEVPQDLRKLSLTARFAIALHCLEGCCRAWRLQERIISEFLDHMWDWPVKMSQGQFDEWESKSREISLVGFGLGNGLPGELVEPIQMAGVTEVEFRDIVENTVEIIWGSFYAASDDVGSMGRLLSVMSVARNLGYHPPPLQAFSNSLFQDNNGWGLWLTSDQRDRWRALTW